MSCNKNFFLSPFFAQTDIFLNNRLSVSYNDSRPSNDFHYYPFGMEMPNRHYNSPDYSLGYQGSMKDDEILGISGSLYTTEFRELDARLGRWWGLDPQGMAGESPYSSMDNSPISMTDVQGNTPSTHTDEEGNVIEVKNDGDKGVYKHEGKGEEAKKELDKNYSSTNTSGGGERMGSTDFIDEFVNPKTHKPEGKILFDQSWESTITDLHNQAMDMNLLEIARNSKSSNKDKIYQFDIKGNPEYAPFGPMTGKLLDGKWATARSAGNYLAGWNGRTGTLMGMHLSKFEYMNLAGSYQQKQYKGLPTAKDIIFNGKTFGPWPYYGEEPYSGRMILQGWNSYRK